MVTGVKPVTNREKESYLNPNNTHTTEISTLFPMDMESLNPTDIATSMKEISTTEKLKVKEEFTQPRTDSHSKVSSTTNPNPLPVI